MNLEDKNINALRILAVDMIENAGSGHPGIALGIAPTLYTLYSRFLNVVPTDDKNIFRDRFVLSAGHGSSIMYATLYAFGYKIKLDDLKNFRKLGSITPGHPEYGIVPGIDATTGPLGQGVSMAVGMAIAQRAMANKFNKPDLTLFDNYTYSLVGEGCLMEGVSYEALSLAGTLKLNKLIVLYDCNSVTLDSNIASVMDTNIMSYMSSLNFNCIEVKDGNDVEEISGAINKAKQSKDKPSFIKINTHIGFGSALQDSNKSHGSLLGAENVTKLRETLGINSSAFELEKDIQRDFVFLRKRFDGIAKTFAERLKSYSKAYPGDYKLLMDSLNNEFDFSNLEHLTVEKEMSGREYGGVILNKIGELNSNLLVGSADVSSSTKVKLDNSGIFNESCSGRNIRYGIREFAMGDISNGIALYGGFVPINSTFMVFSDYMKGALRLSALMKLKTISVFTHDSIAVGEDGATHESCEQLWTLRNMPNYSVYRPANLNETIASYVCALSDSRPAAIVLSRQKLVEFGSSIKDAMMGGYIVSKEKRGELNGVIIATGSEVNLALDTKRLLEEKGYNIRVVSMPCVELFEMQSEKYQNMVIPKDLKSVFSIEAGATSGWYKFTGRFGRCYGVDDYGLSAKPNEIYKHFGLTSEVISKDIIKHIKINADKTISNLYA